MKLFAIFCLVFGQIHAVTDLLQFIESNIDSSISPCDDFYEYSCLESMNETLLEVIQKNYQVELKELEIPEEYKFVKNINESNATILKYIKDNTLKEDVDWISNEFLRICVNEPKSSRRFLLSLRFKSDSIIDFENILYDSDCSRGSKNLKSQLLFFFRNNKRIQKNFDNLAIHFKNIQAYFWLENNIHRLDRATQLYKEFIKEAWELIKNTPWVKNSNSFKAFIEVKKQMVFRKLKKLAKKSLNEVVKVNKDFSTCYESRSRTTSPFCFQHVIVAPTYSLNDADVYTANPWITMHNSLLYILSNDTPLGLIYGTFGFALAREIGHTFIKSRINPSFLPYFSENVKSCVQEQYNKTCEYFGNGTCIDNVTSEEHTANIFGVTLAFKLLKRKSGYNLHKPIFGSKYNITNAQLFHLSYTLFNKNESRQNDNMSKNAGIVQIPDFGSVFKCETGSQMMNSQSEHCYMFGSRAPLLKK